MNVFFSQLVIAVLCMAQSQARGYNRWNLRRGSQLDYNDIDLTESGRRAKEVMGKKVLASVIGILDQLKDIVHDSSLVSTQVCHLEMTMNITGDETVMGTPVFACRYAENDDEHQNNNLAAQTPVQVQEPDQAQDQNPNPELYENGEEGPISDELVAEPNPDELEKQNDDSLWSWRNKYARRYRGRK